MKMRKTIIEGYDMSNNISPERGSALVVKNGCLFVDGKPFVVDIPDEPIKGVEDGRLVTHFRNNPAMINYWFHDEIEGYWA